MTGNTVASYVPTMIKQAIIRILTGFIPSRMLRKRVRTSLLTAALRSRTGKALPSARERQRELAERCRKIWAGKGKIRVAFLVCDASMFSAEPVFRKMRSDPKYECFIAVVPRFGKGKAFLEDTFGKTVSLLSSRYGDCVRVCYDCRTGKAESLAGKAEIVFTSIIYEGQTCGEFAVEPMGRHALVALISYGYSGLFKTNAKRTVFLPNIVFAWKFFVSNRDILDAWTKANPQLAENIELSGYAKMDRLAECQASAAGLRRKKIVIAPHHTLEKATDGLSLSNFLGMSDFFLSLPERYPHIDFVFRPHPLLFPRLATGDWWGEEKTRAYREKMSSYGNVEFQQGGDYFETFAQSSALIHDCGSFLAEYFYTGKPQCYILRKGAESQFLPFGRKLLDRVYRAAAERDILDFIDTVVVKEEDPMRDERNIFATESVCTFHPHAADRIVDSVRAALENGNKGQF